MIQKFDEFVNEGSGSAEDAGLYDKMTDALDRANNIICNHDGTDPEEWEISGPEEALELLHDIDSEEAKSLYNEIKLLYDEMDEMDAEEFFTDDEEEE